MEALTQLKRCREDAGLSQQFVADQLHVSRQSISKWENGRSQPNIDNLIRLSSIYEVSIDDLLKENQQLKEKIKHNNEEIKMKRKALYFIKHNSKIDLDEGLLLLAIASITSFIFPLGLIIVPFIIRRNKISNSFYHLIYIISVCSIISNFYGAYVHFVNYTNYQNFIETNVEIIDEMIDE